MPAAQMKFTFVRPARLGQLFPGVAFTGVPPFVAALEVRVADGARAQKHLVHQNVPHRVASDGAFEIPPAEASGVLIRLRPE